MKGLRTLNSCCHHLSTSSGYLLKCCAEYCATRTRKICCSDDQLCKRTVKVEKQEKSAFLYLLVVFAYKDTSKDSFMDFMSWITCELLEWNELWWFGSEKKFSSVNSETKQRWEEEANKSKESFCEIMLPWRKYLKSSAQNALNNAHLIVGWKFR